jgi:hypothetical protein
MGNQNSDSMRLQERIDFEIVEPHSKEKGVEGGGQKEGLRSLDGIDVSKARTTGLMGVT